MTEIETHLELGLYWVYYGLDYRQDDRLNQTLNWIFWRIFESTQYCF